MKLIVSSLSLLIVFVVSTSLDGAETLPTAFFKTHCSACHADGASEGGLDLSQLGSDLSEAKTMARWVRIYDRVRDGEMPPPDADQPSAKERADFLKAFGEPLTKAHAAQKGTVLRRLNRQEYENTINDLFGTNLDLVSLLPEDGRSHEFENVGEALSISMVQLNRYLEAIDLALDNSIAQTVTRPQSQTKRVSYADTREAERFLGSVWLKRPDGAVVFFKSGGYPSGMCRDANARESGRYKIRIKGYAYQSDKPVTFAVGSTTFQRGAEIPTYGYYAFPPDKPTLIELDVWMKERYMVEITPFGINDRNNAIRNKGIENYKGPGLAIQYIELEGPIQEEFPSRGHHLIFQGLTRKEVEPRNPNDKKRRGYQPTFEIVSSDPVRDVAPVLQRIASRAYRRPATAEQTAPFVALFQSELEQGAKFEEALRTAVAAIFCSPDFLYLREQPGQLDDYALAARLAYFLTRTLPDEELLAVAKSGQLSQDPKILAAQTERLLNDPRSERFITDFTDAWLNLRDIEFTMPDRNLFPEFDQFLQYSMLAETQTFWRELIEKNLGVTNIVQSDFAMLNNRLAHHYGIEGVEGPDIRRVTLPKGSSRGGFLSQGAVLKVSANGTNTSPVVRGVWVAERMLGETPPPPPPGVPGVEPDIRGAQTLRELLAKHRNSDNCRACHQKIDPPGFALENFNPIGGWRDRFRSLGEGERVDVDVDGRRVRYKLGPPVDATGEWADGREFSGFLEFRDQLATNPDRLTKTLATKLLIFATGREMGFSDRPEIERIVQASAQNGHGIRDLIHLVVASEIFRHK